MNIHLPPSTTEVSAEAKMAVSDLQKTLRADGVFLEDVPQPD